MLLIFTRSPCYLRILLLLSGRVSFIPSMHYNLSYFTDLYVAGYQKLAAATCNTVFWAGDIFAWKRKAPDGSDRGLSTFFQDAMCDAYAELAQHLDGLEAVLGFEVRVS